MEDTIKTVVSMLASDKKTTLFTSLGEIIDIAADGPYDIDKISEFLTPQLTGTSAVEIDLSNFMSVRNSVFDTPELAAEGIVMTHIINGKEVQGIFYPQDAAVTVTVGDDKVEIPNVDNLSSHMQRATKDGSPSVVNFFKRLAEVIKDRRHSGEDLMTFIKRSEMPLTNDGRIIAYKRVRLGDSDEEGSQFFVDVHSGQIKQRVGSRVTMPVDMVDPSRHHSCSTGLHVANLGYLRGFAGDYTLVVLVDPENFIAVPHGEDTKARVCSYDIVGVMPSTAHQKVCQGNHVEGDVELSALIISAVEGTTIEPFEEVFVGRQVVDRVETLEPIGRKPLKTSAKTSGKSLNEDPNVNKPTKTKTSGDLAKTTRAAKNLATGGKTEGLPEEVLTAFKLLNSPSAVKAHIARELNTSTRSLARWMEKYDFAGFVEEAKQRYDVVMRDVGKSKIHVIKQIRLVMGLGLKESKDLSEGDGIMLTNVDHGLATKLVVALSEAGAFMMMFKHGEMVVNQDEEEPMTDLPKVPEPTPKVAKPTTGLRKPVPVAKLGSVPEQAQTMYDFDDDFEALKAFKKKKKKSWTALGFNETQIRNITEN